MWVDLIGLALFYLQLTVMKPRFMKTKTQTILAETLSIAQKSKILISVFC